MLRIKRQLWNEFWIFNCLCFRNCMHAFYFVKFEFRKSNIAWFYPSYVFRAWQSLNICKEFASTTRKLIKSAWDVQSSTQNFSTDLNMWSVSLLWTSFLVQSSNSIELFIWRNSYTNSFQLRRSFTKRCCHWGNKFCYFHFCVFA